jgi:hypothetical protein
MVAPPSCHKTNLQNSFSQAPWGKAPFQNQPSIHRDLKAPAHPHGWAIPMLLPGPAEETTATEHAGPNKGKCVKLQLHPPPMTTESSISKGNT